MKIIDKRNLVYFAAQEAWARYGDHLAGLLSGPVCVVSERTLPDLATHALDASAAQLGYGEGAITYITLRPCGETDAGTTDASGKRNDSKGPNAEGSASLLNANAKSLASPLNANAEDAASIEARPLSPSQLFGLVESVDPMIVVATDAQSMATLSRAYQVDFPRDTATRLLGRTAVGFADFSAMLSSTPTKQKAWVHLKRLGSKPKPR